jgi:hypothetical protein
MPAEMASGWGFAEFYTPSQVRAALRHLGLDGPYAVVAYGAFLTKEDFVAHAEKYSTIIPYDRARSLFSRYRPLPGKWGYVQEPLTNEQAVGRYGLGLG